MAPHNDKPLHGVVFDMDGTLLDTEALATESMQATVDAFGKTMTWDIKKNFLGLRPAEWAPMLIKIFELEGKINSEEMIAQWEKAMHEKVAEVQKCHGAEKTTTLLKEMGVPQSIATSSTRAGMTAKRTNHEEMFSRMEYVVTGDDPEVKHGKPAPDIYLAAAKRMGLDPSHCLAFEDALSGVKAAKGAGMYVIAIPDSRLDPKPFEEAGASVILKSMDDWDASAWHFEPLPKDEAAEAPETTVPSTADASAVSESTAPEVARPVE